MSCTMSAFTALPSALNALVGPSGKYLSSCRLCVRDYVIQFRASGVRIKRPTTAPSLIAILCPRYALGLSALVCKDGRRPISALEKCNSFSKTASFTSGTGSGLGSRRYWIFPRVSKN
jgi:hypothetical protein